MRHNLKTTKYVYVQSHRILGSQQKSKLEVKIELKSLILAQDERWRHA